jgi:hypothetical protein
MSEADDAGALDLSGVWHGQYSYPRNRAPVPFVATLTESNGWLTGATEETGVAGDARGLTITATLQGRRTGRSVTWLKIYDGSFRLYDSVQYAGDINGDGTEIEGRWTVPGSWSGKFLMIRFGGLAGALLQKATERV